MTPGDVVTAHLSGGVGAEKDKERPVVVIHQGPHTTLVVAVTDARKKRLPTHVLVRNFSSGTQIKDALVTCEHAWFLDPMRLVARDGARPLDETERLSVGLCLRTALGLAPSRPPPAVPTHRRGSWVQVDFSGGIGHELTGEHPALVLSNDAGNYFGRTLLVAPRAGEDIDLLRLRVVDLERVRGSVGEALPAEALADVESRLQAMLPWGP